jgi:hypothetical protein
MKFDNLVDEVFEDAQTYHDNTGRMPQAGEERHSYANGLADGLRYVLGWLGEEGLGPSQIAARLSGQPVAA